MRVAIDRVDRPTIEVALLDGMLEHVLRSFAHEARITLHIVLMKGPNPQQVTKATLKALGLALREATRPSDRLVSPNGRVAHRT